MIIRLPAPLIPRLVTGLLVVSAAGVVAACSSGTPAPTSTVTVTQPPPSGSPSASSSSPAATARPSPIALRQCRASGLRVSVAYDSGAAGTRYYDIRFTNVSPARCFLQGYPGVSLVSRGSNAGSQIGADAKRDPAIAVLRITLAPGQTAHAVLGITEAANYPPATCQPVTAHWLKVFPPGEFTAAYVSFTTSTCASTSQPTMRIRAVSAGT